MSSAIDLKLGQQGVLSKVRLVIFDKDGTLIELYRYWSAMVGLRARLISEKLGIGRQHLSGLVYAMGVDRESGS